MLFSILICAEMYSYIKIDFTTKPYFRYLTIFLLVFLLDTKKEIIKICLLYDTLKEKQHDLSSKELIYRSIINNIDTAV
jgi:hypothetical protein